MYSGQTQNFSNKPKKFIWLWLTLAVLVLAVGGYFGWQYSKKLSSQTAAVPTPTPEVVTNQSVSEDLASVTTDLQTLDDNFNQLDKIDSSQDVAPSL